MNFVNKYVGPFFAVGLLLYVLISPKKDAQILIHLIIILMQQKMTDRVFLLYLGVSLAMQQTIIHKLILWMKVAYI